MSSRTRQLAYSTRTIINITHDEILPSWRLTLCQLLPSFANRRIAVDHAPGPDRRASKFRLVRQPLVPQWPTLRIRRSVDRSASSSRFSVKISVYDCLVMPSLSSCCSRIACVRRLGEDGSGVCRQDMHSLTMAGKRERRARGRKNSRKIAREFSKRLREIKSRSSECGVCVPGAGRSDFAGTAFRHGQFLLGAHSARWVPGYAWGAPKDSRSEGDIGACCGISRNPHNTGCVRGWNSYHIAYQHSNPENRRERVANEGLWVDREACCLHPSPAYQRRRGAPEEAQRP